MSYTDLPFIYKVKTNQKEFGEKVIDISKKLGISPYSLMVVMNNESGLNHLAQNPTSSAFGLIQFMSATLNEMGITREAMARLSNVQQLSYVFKYLSTYSGRMIDTADVYAAVFFPMALFEPLTWRFPSWAVKANPIFDINKDGVLTKKEFEDYVNKKYSNVIPIDVQVALSKKKVTTSATSKEGET